LQLNARTNHDLVKKGLRLPVFRNVGECWRTNHTGQSRPDAGIRR
jgi:hypothetical protein